MSDNVIKPFNVPAAWDAETLRQDQSWVIRLNDGHREELFAALAHFKQDAHDRGLTAQWLHGNMTPRPENFPLPTLAGLLRQAQTDLEEKYGLILIKGMPVEHQAPRDLQLLYAGLAGHIGTLRPQTMFGEVTQDIKDIGQAPLIERRGSKHNRALSFHTDPCDVISLLCIQPAHAGGEGLFVSSLAIHNALLEATPEHVRTLYEDFSNTYQDYLFVRTGTNQDWMPRQATYAMPTFTAEQGRFACKYSRFYIDQAQAIDGIPRLSAAQTAALDALEREMANEKWCFRIRYEPGDAIFSNNFICLHARTAFSDDGSGEDRRRHLLRIWLAMPNSRPLSPRYRHFFFQDTAAGALRGGISLPGISYS
ncbi:MAG: TauD/TfdA family dioxygenase [Gallionellaceae bacterium]|nr:TauD/TfdA family dioxygenase [Gallionellaceae bacterium]MDD5367072.1 TauD/TfdA family dioxygenase [Gallionellaceae bacterium]